MTEIIIGVYYIKPGRLNIYNYFFFDNLGDNVYLGSEFILIYRINIKIKKS